MTHTIIAFERADGGGELTVPFDPASLEVPTAGSVFMLRATAERVGPHELSIALKHSPRTRAARSSRPGR